MVLIVPSRQLWVGDDAHKAKARQLHAAFVSRLNDSGIQVVDMRNRLEQYGNPLFCHFANDGHWNDEGHRLAAEALAELLQKNGKPKS